MNTIKPHPIPNRLYSILRWFDSYNTQAHDALEKKRIDWLRAVPFILLHVACLGVILVGWSPVAVLVAVVMYGLRMFAITAFYHRYFSHKAFKTSRLMQFVFALLGATAVQRGPLWWASHHRHHHTNSDSREDNHSPHQSGFLWSHMGWFLSNQHFHTKHHYIKDFSKVPELHFIDRFDVLMPVVLALILFISGELLANQFPELGTNGWQMFIWGFVVSTVVLYHGTFTINSFAHRFGKRSFNTKDDSRNNFWLALITFGEGWHNNHHYYPGSARQGFRWWQIDLTYYVLKVMAWLGLIWDLRPVPKHVYTAGRIK